MTNYELLTQRIESLERRVKETMPNYAQSIWEKHLYELKESRGGMTVSDAGIECWAGSTSSFP